MRRSYSYSKREMLERCARQYYYEYYASSKKAPINSARKALIQQLKQMSNRHLIAGAILHRLIKIRLTKGRGWNPAWFLQNARIWFEQHHTYSRDPEKNAYMLQGRYPPILLTEYYYDISEKETLTEKTCEKLMVALRNFFKNSEVVSIYDGLVEDDFEVEKRIGDLNMDGYAVTGSVDLVIKNDRAIQIIDWKMGLPTESQSSLQLFIYGWWASKRFNVDSSNVTVRRVFLGNGTLERSKLIDETLIKRGQARLLQDVELMEELDRYGRKGLEGAFSKCEKQGLCQKCNYRQACMADS